MIPQRVAKLERLRQRNIDPYPASYRRTHTIAQAAEQYLLAEAGQGSEKGASPVSIAGRLVLFRPMGKVTFGHLEDGSGRLQIYLRQGEVPAESYGLLRDLDLGDVLGASGHLFRTRTGEVTLQVESLTVLAKALRNPPEKWHGLADVEKRYRQRYLDLMANPKVREIFRVRSRVIASMRRFLDERGFLEVETPVLQPLYGGAAAKPFETYHQALDRKLYLRIATELYLKRLIIGGYERVYEISKDFRNEGVSTKHNPEFTMMESYQAYADYLDVMEMVEQMVPQIALEVLGTTRLTYQGCEIELSPPWRRLTLHEALQELAGIDLEKAAEAETLRSLLEAKGLALEPGLAWGKLVDEAISAYVEPNLIQPTFLMDYPVQLSPLAKKKQDNPALVERFEPFVAGLELGNAFSELNDPLDQRARFEQQACLRQAGDEEAQPLDEDFLVALEHGMPPTGGLGIGIDRLVMLFTNQPSIRDVILFPQLRTPETFPAD